MNATMSFDFTDTVKFKAALNRLGAKEMQKCVKKAAQKGSNIAGSAIRAAVPVRTGQLRKGFKKRQEKSKRIGRVVYDYAMDSAKNSVFQRPIKNPGQLGGKNPKGYYPNSVEYGFLARAKGGGIVYYRHGRFYSREYKAGQPGLEARLESKEVPGTHAVKKAAESVAPQVSSTIQKVLFEEVDKAWKS